MSRTHEDLLIPLPKRRLDGHLLTFLLIAFFFHIPAYLWISQHVTGFAHKTPSLVNVHVLIEPPPPPLPKPKPPPKPKMIQPVHPMAAAPLLHVEQVKFHETRHKETSEPSNLQSVEELKGGSTFGNPEGVPGGKGPIEDTGKSVIPPTKPRPLVPDRKNPAVISRCQPPYPEMERDQGIEGSVGIMVLVGRMGEIEDVRITQSSGNSSLDTASLENVRLCWKFAPAVQNGEPVEARLTFSIVFRLQ